MLEHLRGLREDKDLKQKNIAELLGITQSAYSDYERGKRNIPNDILKKLALFHETSLDYILELTDDPRPYPRRKKRPWEK